jgi:hypothetical protein
MNSFTLTPESAVADEEAVLGAVVDAAGAAAVVAAELDA